MISLRTLINTTIFWALAGIVFWGYTKWIDNTPAKELLYTIGWSDLGNLTITTNENFGITNETQLIQKIDAMEKMIQATNMSCTIMQLNTTTQGASLGGNTLINSIIPTQHNQQIILPVFNTILNTQLPDTQKATAQALTMIKRTVNDNPNISDIFQLIINPQLTTIEQGQGNINIFEGTNLLLGQYTLDNGTLTLPIIGSESLSSAQFEIISAILEKTYTQFPEIKNIIVQQV